MKIEYMYEDPNIDNTPVLLPKTTNETKITDIMTNNGYVET